MLAAVFSLSLIVGCGGGGSSTASTEPVTVNLLGTWDYLLTTQNSTCDGMEAAGTGFIDDLNGDTTKIGDTYVEGTGFDVSAYPECYLTSGSYITSGARGLPSTMTANEFEVYVEKSYAGDNTVASITVDSFTNNKIIVTIEYTIGAIYTQVFTR